MRELFVLFDTMGDDRIAKNQLGTLLRALGENPTEAEVKKYASQLTDERITFDVFLPIWEDVKRNKKELNAEHCVEGLKNFDREGNGQVTLGEMRHLLTTLGEKLSDEEVDQLLAPYASSGIVNYEEFVRTILNQ